MTKLPCPQIISFTLVCNNKNLVSMNIMCAKYSCMRQCCFCCFFVFVFACSNPTLNMPENLSIFRQFLTFCVSVNKKEQVSLPFKNLCFVTKAENLGKVSHIMAKRLFILQGLDQLPFRGLTG